MISSIPHRPPQCSQRSQRGIGLIGLLFVGAFCACVLLIGMKVFPTAVEYMAVQKAVKRAAGEGTSIPSVQASFDRAAAIDDIKSITGRDLVITPVGNKFKVDFAYSRKIELFGPASLVLDYQGSATSK